MDHIDIIESIDADIAALEAQLPRAKNAREYHNAKAGFPAPLAITHVPQPPSPIGLPSLEPIPQMTVARGVARMRRGEKRTCDTCKKPKGRTAFTRGATTCRACSGWGFRMGADSPSHAVHSKQSAGTLADTGVYVLTTDEYHSHKRGSVDALYDRLARLTAKTDHQNVILTTTTGHRVEVITREEIEGGASK